MIAYNFHTIGKDASGQASVGQGKLTHPVNTMTSPASAYRARCAGSGEQQLVARLVDDLGSLFSRSLLVAYYVSLKTNPFVVLTGREGAGKAALAAGVAASLVGQDSGQFVTIGSDSWTGHGTQSTYYRDIHARFGISQLLETMHEAAVPENAGKAYLVLLKGLTLEELDLYLSQLLRVEPHGERRLVLSGLPAAQHPVVPRNCFLTATINVPQFNSPLADQVLRHAGQIQFSPSLATGTVVPNLLPPPVGLQRVMLTATTRDPGEAHARLVAILGRRELRNLRPSPELMRHLYRQHLALEREVREEALVYVANSFDAEGRGLFEPTDAQQNAQVAFDAQVVQRILWRLEGHAQQLPRDT
ncbi:hypothetical protein [Candidatus Chloroploca sp. Khr17]|uniref:hypothetical protein n=1 Tax=Candidatus Chloroploca sp. Khr17 TaxID=2496869 RepID=UPI00101BADC9|nr:hypothetical protein [Candidatus Chloroploca sp. Khr17]